MRYFMLWTVQVSSLLVISYSTAFDEPIRFDHELDQSDKNNQDLSLGSDLNPPLFDAGSTSADNGKIASALEQCDGDSGGDQPLGKLRARLTGSCSPKNNLNLDEIQWPNNRLIPHQFTPTSDDEDCRKFLPMRFVEGKKFLWSVCDSGLSWDPDLPNFSPDDVIYAANGDLPFYDTYDLYNSMLSRFIQGTQYHERFLIS